MKKLSLVAAAAVAVLALAGCKNGAQDVNVVDTAATSASYYYGAEGKYTITVKTTVGSVTTPMMTLTYTATDKSLGEGEWSTGVGKKTNSTTYEFYIEPMSLVTKEGNDEASDPKEDEFYLSIVKIGDKYYLPTSMGYSLGRFAGNDQYILINDDVDLEGSTVKLPGFSYSYKEGDVTITITGESSLTLNRL